MDSLTHIAIGACIGEAFFERGFGKKAMLWGALAQSIPDIDFISTFWLSTSQNLLAHRGFTHSVLFALLIIPVFALTAHKTHRLRKIPMKTWFIFFAIELFLHLLLDSYNNYGVGLLEPFSHQRYSLNALYVADPFFSIWAGIAFIMLIILNPFSNKRRFWWRFGLIIPFIYFCYCTKNKIKINRDTLAAFEKQHIPHERYFTTPAPLQNWLWFIVAGNDSGYYAGYRSVFDKTDQIRFHYFPRNDSLLKPVAGHPDLQNLIRFSQQFYTVESRNDTLLFNDLRFGQIIGWQNPSAEFAFHYYLQYPGNNTLVVQRGRFSGWNWHVLAGYWKRIKGI